jgi:hypothetical protein
MNLKDIIMTQEIINNKNLFERYRRIQNICDNLLAKMEDCFDQNLILEDPKELIRLEHLLKLRSRLLDFDREIRTEYDTISVQSQEATQKNRESLMQEIIKKINQATRLSE